MKIQYYLPLAFILFAFQLGAQDNYDFFNSAELFFKQYADNGRVDYKALKDNSMKLDELIQHLGNDPLPAGEEKAYLINAYNLFVISKVVGAYPISSPMDVDGFFMKEDFLLNGEKISLNHLENEVLRKDYADPRLHFVLVCGAIGCPPIVNYAYTPDKLDGQMEKQTRLALNNDAFVYANEEGVFLSEIFNWYTEDFGKNVKEAVAYINTYRTDKFADKGVKFYPYNWQLNVKTDDKVTTLTQIVSSPQSTTNDVPNLQLFTAGSLLGQGKMDFTLFNTLYTESENNWQGQRFSGYRATFVTHLFQWTIGVTKNKRFNVGLDLNFRSSGFSTDSTLSGISNAFSYKNNDSSRVGLTSAGLRLKVQPFKSVADFSIQSTFLIPTIEAPEGRSDPSLQNLYWADWDRFTWWNQIFYSKNFGQKFQLFAEVDLLFRFKRNNSQVGMLDIPSSVFLSYFPTRKITVYAMTQHLHRFTNNINPQDPVVTDWVIPANYTASGIGFKYQILSNLNIELLYTNFWRGTNSGLGNTLNLGLKLLTR